MRMPVHCPACEGQLQATRLVCRRCGTAVESVFNLGLAALDRDDDQFARAFLLARGNLRELERSLGLSYAALRGRLDALVTHLEGQIAEALSTERPQAAPEEARGGVQTILDRLEAGEIDAATAARWLREGAES